jgi:hypothetical protein
MNMPAKTQSPTLPFKARCRRFSYALMSALAAMALTACAMPR